MAIRSDLTIQWDLSPRIITIDAPSTAITMQDLYDSMRDIEPVQIDEEYIIDGAGGEPLGGGVLVGLTLTLNNAKVAFEARPGPEYVQCNISGGNLVAVDENGDSMSAIEPTAFTQIVQANSSSATQTDLAAIQFASFGGGVSVDVLSSNSGVEYPVGNLEYPVNNITDARAIAYTRGFKTFFIRGDITLGAGDDVSEFLLDAENASRSTITIEDAAVTDRCEIQEAFVTGTLDNGIIIRRCVVENLSYFNGYVYTCILNPGTITLGNNAVGHFLDCYSGVPGTGTPTIDMSGSGQALSMRNYNGGIKIVNKTGPEAVSIDLGSGQIKLDPSTVTNGTIVCRGDGKVIDADTNIILESGVVDFNGATVYNETSLAYLKSISYIDKAIYINTELVTTGDGKISNPFNNVSDAVDFAERLGWKKLIFLADATLERTLKNFTIEGIGLPAIDFNGQDVDKSEFIKVKLFGQQVGTITAREVMLLNGVTGLNGVYKESGIAGTITCAENAIISMASISTLFIANHDPYIIDMGAANTNVKLNVRKLSGGIAIQNCNTSSKLATIAFSAGHITIDNTNTAGTIGIAGIPDTAITDNNGGSNIVIDGVFPGAETNATTLLNTPMSAYTIIGTFGSWIKKILYTSK